MSQPLKVLAPIRLKDFNPSFHEGMDKDKAREKTVKLCQRIGELQNLLYAEARQSLVVVLQGMDTSGKDGVVRHVFDNINPAGVEVVSFKTPSSEEIAHDFLWRIHHALPRYGHVGIFNRSHYEDVLVVRVLKLQPAAVWRARYDQINAFEKHLTSNRIALLKLFLHISRDEQANRLRARLTDRQKNWKFVPDDLKMRAYWSKFQKAYEDAINYCSTHYAPWHVIPANHKWYRDYAVAKLVVKALEDLKPTWPAPRADLSKIKVT
jgi:PPK2 family polyphosphate:nucleotide phosphotransferase